MKTVPEVVLAKEAGLSYTSIALPRDYDCWKDTVIDQQRVLAVFATKISRVKTLIENVVGKIGQEDWVEMPKTNQDCAANSIIMGSQVDSM